MTMSFQAHDGHAARSEDLHRHILRSHLAYLNQEETPAKLEQRRNLESLISEFLCVVSHNAKFTFVEIASILNSSIESNPNFSAYKSQSAFEALEKYATNLISHPWRKEYKTVKLYSGFYKHSVESQLLQGNSVFELLGYQYTEDGMLYLDEPVDPDKVARVALDCLIAYVECQVMVQIWEKIKSFKCTWIEIHSIREDYVCGIDEAVRLLHQMKRNAVEQDKQSRWLRNQENGFNHQDKKEQVSNYPRTGVLVDVSNTWPSDDKFTCYGDNSVSQSAVSEVSYKANKSILSHSKLPSWSEGVTSQSNDYRSRNLISKSNEIDGYTSRSFDDHIQSNYSFLNKSINPVSRYTSSSIIPDSWTDSWDMIHPPLQSGSYHRNGSFVNCDLDSHRTGYDHTVPNIKEPYSQFGHMYPPHPMMPLGIPAFPYPLPHEFSIPPRQCQCRMCCENPLSMTTNKYQQSKDNISSAFEHNLRSLSRHEANSRNDPDICDSFTKMSIDNSKSRNFPTNSSAYSSYQTINECTSNVILRPDAEKILHSNSKRGSYYDNVPSTFENDSNTCVVGSSLNSKCDFQPNGIIPSNSLTLSKSRSQKGTSVTDSVSNGHSLKLQRKTSSNLPFNNLEKSDILSGISSDSKSIRSNQPVATIDVKSIRSNQSLASTDSKSARSNQSVVSMDSKSIRSNQSITITDSKAGKKWSCTSCTFYNAPDKSICDMCGRSKHPGPEITPLVSGGRECPQCTLVNKKDSENCTACGASLKDSPTYI